MVGSAVIDRSTQRYLARLARESGYFQREFNPKPTRAILNDAGLRYISSEDIEMKTGEVATVYKIKLEQESGDCLEDSLIENGCAKTVFATDWAIDTGSGYDHLTYYFDSTPTSCDIEKARIINKVKHAIEAGALKQQFSCRSCDKRVHWTDLTPPTPNSCDAYKQQIIMLRNQQCSCCNKGGISQIVQPDEVDEYILARPADVMTSPKAE